MEEQPAVHGVVDDGVQGLHDLLIPRHAVTSFLFTLSRHNCATWLAIQQRLVLECVSECVQYRKYRAVVCVEGRLITG